MICLLLHVRPLAAQSSDEIGRNVQHGLAVLSKGDYDGARKTFYEALKTAKAENDKDWTARLNFYMGLAWHRQVSNESKPFTKRAIGLLKRAQKYYGDALKLNPESSGGSNNLAQVNALLGEKKRAEIGFQTAIKLGGNKQVTYILNYADFLYDSERWDEAARFYGLALEQQPNSARANEGLAKYYRERQRENFGALLWEQVEQGKTRQALASALEAIQQPGWNETQYVEFITCVARCLSLQKVASVEQLPDALEAINEHNVVGPAAKEIRQLYIGERLDPEAYPWWSAKVARVDESIKAPRGGWPQEAFTALINSRGDYFKQSDQPEPAIKLYQLAYDLTPYHVDPRAMVKMADIWVKHDQTGKLEDFLSQQENRLFNQKSGAIENMQHKRTYELHRSLASVYAHLDRWEDPSGFRNAEYQLKAALEDARKHNESLDKSSKEKVIVDSQLVAKLSDRYMSQDKMSEAYSLNVVQADYLKGIGAVNAARDVFQVIEKTDKPTGVNDSIEEKRTKLETELKSHLDSPKPYVPGRAFGQGGFGTLNPGLVKVADVNGNVGVRWMKVGDPKKVTIWYPADAGLTKKELDQATVALERLLTYDRGKAARTGADPTIRKGSGSWKSAGQLEALPDWVPANITLVERSGGHGRLVVKNEGKLVELRFDAPGSSEFKYMRFETGPVRPDPKPVRIPDPKLVPKQDPKTVRKPDPKLQRKPDPKTEVKPTQQPKKVRPITRPQVASLKWTGVTRSKAPASLRSSKRTVVEFQNKSRRTVKIYSVDTSGKRSRTPLVTLKTGKTHSQATQSGSSWMVTDEQGRELGHFVATEQKGVAQIPN